MFKYVVKRLLLALFILVAVSIILYGLIRLMPSNVIVDKYWSTHKLYLTGTIWAITLSEALLRAGGNG